MTATAIDLRKVTIEIQGLPPGLLFQGKGVMEQEAREKSTKKTKHSDPKKEAELRAHWMGRGTKKQLCIPWVMFYRSFCRAAGDFQWALNKKKTMIGIVAASVACETDFIGLGNTKYEVFEEYVRIPPKTGSMVKIGRPLIKKWNCKLPLLVDDEQWDVTQFEEIVKHAGKTVGIGAWRPQLQGPYGRYVIDKFEVD